MPVPSRIGFEDAVWQKKAAPLDREREALLAHTGDLTDIGGGGVIWYHPSRVVIPSSKIGIQAGIVDDLPSLLSALSVEIGWPGAPVPTAPGPYPPDQAIGVWARVWQVREGADLRVTLHWTDRGEFDGGAELRPLRDAATPLLDREGLVALLDDVARTPRSSESPHGLLIAGNRAMQAEQYAEARALYERAMTDLPNHPEAHRNLALTQARLDAWEEAACLMRRAYELAPADPGLQQEYRALETDAGIRAVQDGDPERAAEHFLQILRHWPDDPTALTNLGNIRLREGHPHEALAIFRRFLRHHPEHAAAQTVRLAVEELEGEQGGKGEGETRRNGG